MTLGTAFRALGEFAFLYPLFMAYVWISGSIYYYFYREKSDRRQYYNPPSLSEYPSVTFIVPCHNEGENIRETLLAIVDQQYPRFEIIAVNDGSTDQTGELLEELADRYDEIRVIHLATNQGKAMAMRVGTIASNNEILICLDGDALLDKHATPWIVRHFIDGPRVGARSCPGSR